MSRAARRNTPAARRLSCYVRPSRSRPADRFTYLRSGTIEALSMAFARIKQGKTTSIVGFISGLVFVAIGVFVAIPVFGGFGIAWTAIAAVIAAAHGYSLLSKKGGMLYEMKFDDGKVKAARRLAERTGRAELRACLRRRRDAPHAAARPGRRDETPPDRRGRVLPRLGLLQAIRSRQAAKLARKLCACARCAASRC